MPISSILAELTIINLSSIPRVRKDGLSMPMANSYTKEPQPKSSLKPLKLIAKLPLPNSYICSDIEGV